MQDYSTPIQTENIKTLDIPNMTKSLLQTWGTEMKTQEIFIFAHHRNAQDKSNQIGVQETPTDTEIGSDFTPTLNASTSNRNYSQQ